MKPVRCPKCQLRWNIRDDMPPVFTCPRCLTALQNPYPSLAFPEQRTTPPRQVIPVERQARGDMRMGMIGLVIVVAAVGFGLLTLLGAGVRGEGLGVLVVVGLLAIVATCIGMAMYARKSGPGARSTPAIAPGISAPPVVGTRPLDYQWRMPRERVLSGGQFFGQAIGGIIAGIVGSIAFAAALAGLNSDFIFMAIFIAPAAGIALCFVPRARGFGVGLLISLPVAFVLILGFCAILMSGSNWHGS